MNNKPNKFERRMREKLKQERLEKMRYLQQETDSHKKITGISQGGKNGRTR